MKLLFNDGADILKYEVITNPGIYADDTNYIQFKSIKGIKNNTHFNLTYTVAIVTINKISKKTFFNRHPVHDLLIQGSIERKIQMLKHVMHFATKQKK